MWDPALDHKNTLKRIYKENTEELHKCLKRFDILRFELFNPQNEAAKIKELKILKERMKIHSNMIHRSHTELLRRRILEIRISQNV
jgi:hypothetical protein